MCGNLVACRVFIARAPALGLWFFASVNEEPNSFAPTVRSVIITLKQTARRCPTVGAAAPAALGGRRAGA